MSLWQGLLNATIQAINAKMGHKHLFEQMAESVDVLVNMINPAHSLVLVFDQCPPFSHHLDHHLISGLGV